LSVETCIEPAALSCEFEFTVREYDLSATLACGQAFNWELSGAGWTGVVAGRWVRLRQIGNGIRIETAEPQAEWSWLENYLQAGVELEHILKTFPADERLREAVTACRGLRLLRQDPWECLASFILSSTKQIIQIRQIIGLLRTRFGSPLAVPAGEVPAFAFPTAAQLACLSESELRKCKMGFRATYLLTAARRVASGECDLNSLTGFSLAEARAELLKFHGIGEKIADCVLLFAYGFPTAFPVDVWVAKALRNLYFRGRKIPLRRLREFSATHFGPQAGYAQQYLFHYIRTRPRKKVSR
jgi:N-glycosylase/DNA lyase